MVRIESCIYSVSSNCRYRLVSTKKFILVKIDNKCWKLSNLAIVLFSKLLSPHIYSASDLTINYVDLVSAIQKLFNLGIICSNLSYPPIVINKEILFINKQIPYCYVLATKDKVKIDKSKLTSVLESNELSLTEDLLLKNVLIYDYPKATTLNNDYSYYVVFSYNCDFSCVYCFQKNFFVSESQSVSIISKLKKIIRTHNSNDKITIVFFGGEPLLAVNLALINDIISLFFKKGIKFRVVTNGLHISDFQRKFPVAFSRISQWVVTIDGPQPIHDKRRVLKDGSGSFHKIMNELKNVIQIISEVVIRINIDSTNSSMVIDLIYYLFEFLGNGASCLSFFITPITNNENPKNEDFKIIDRLFEIYKQVRMLGIKNVVFDENFITYCSFLDNDAEYIFDKKLRKCNLASVLLVDTSSKIHCCNESNKYSFFEVDSNCRKRKIPVVPVSDDCKNKCEFYFLCDESCHLRRFNLKEEIKITNCSKRSIYKRILDEHYIKE